MKVLHVTNYDSLGGAGIAAYRLHTTLRADGVDSRMLVRRKGTNDPTVKEVGSFTPVGSRQLIIDNEIPQQPISQQLRNCWARLPVRARGWLAANLIKAIGMEGCSLNILPTGLHKVLNASDVDVIHLHWINNEMISIQELAKIKKPIVWTLHDMWPLCGAEHHSFAEYWRHSEDRSQKAEVRDQKLGYGSQMSDGQTLIISNQRLATKAMLFNAVNRMVFNRKMQAWRNLKVSFIAPSNWMAEQARQSRLFAGAPVETISNSLNLQIFKPMDNLACRAVFHLPLDKKLILFGAYNPLDPNKGLDLLERALAGLPGSLKTTTEVVVFGVAGQRQIAGLPTRWVGAICSERKMAEIYNACDVTCVPSRRESFGMTAMESLACGVPVAAFQTSGLIDVVTHKEDGYLAQPYDTHELGRGIAGILTGYLVSPPNCRHSAACARGKAEAMFDSRVSALRHLDIYRKLALIAEGCSSEKI